jgi:hypothetical protein
MTREIRKKVYFENLKRKDNFKDLVIDGTVIAYKNGSYPI